MSRVLSVGIVGAGVIGRSHMAAIGPLDTVRVAAVMDIDPTRARKAAAEHGARAFTSLDALLADRSVAAVHVCSPHDQHAAQVTAAAATGRHVLVEKPMALTLADCDRMIAACQRAGTVLMVGQVMRYTPVHRKVRALIGAGAIGTVGHLVRRRCGYFDPTSPTSPYGRWYLDEQVAGNCLLYSFGPHEYDILHWYIDSPVIRVYAQGTQSTRLYQGQADSCSALLTHANGAVSLLAQSIVCRTNARDQIIIGSGGSITETKGQLTLNGAEIPVQGEPGMAAQICEFAACCLEGRQPDASGHSVRHTMAVIEAVKLSARRDEPVLVSALS